MTVDLPALLRSRRSVRQFLDRELLREEIASLLDDAVWAPSGGNAQPWSITALSPSRTLALLERYEKRMWAALLPRVVHMLGETGGDPSTHVERAQRAIQNEVLVQGRPWLLFVWATHVPVEPSVVRSVHEALGERSPSLATMLHASGDLDREVTAAGVAGFAYGLTLLAHARGWGACLQSTWLAFAEELTAELTPPVAGARLAAAVMVGHKAREPVARPRRPVPVVWDDARTDAPG